MTKLTDKIYHDEDAARAHFERIRWPDGRTCHHCGVVDNSTLLKGKTTRPGLYKCNACRKPFTATMGTIYERSHIPLHKWLLATHLMCSSKKGISAAQLHRNLGFGSYRTAWFMAHRIREAMRSDRPAPMGGEGQTVEADETYFGRKAGVETPQGGFRHKLCVVSLVNRDTGEARSVFTDKTTHEAVAAVVRANVDRESRLVTDDHVHYWKIGKEFAAHQRVRHSIGEYGRGDVHTNTIEGFFSIFKRGMRGIYQHCGSQHLHRYLAEYDFRYTYREATGCDDTERTKRAVAGTIGRRLMYARPNLTRA